MFSQHSTHEILITLIKFSINSATRPITHKSKIIISTLITLLTFQWDLSGLNPAILWTTHSIWCSSTSVICINLETTRFNLVRRLNTKNYKVISASFRHALLPIDLTASWCGDGFVSISTLITPLDAINFNRSNYACIFGELLSSQENAIKSRNVYIVSNLEYDSSILPNSEESFLEHACGGVGYSSLCITTQHMQLFVTMTEREVLSVCRRKVR